MSTLEDNVAELRRQALGINRSFAELSPLLERIHLMSFNAKLASHRLGHEGLSFSVIVTEVRAMAQELRVLIKEAEKEFWVVVNEVATWSKVEKENRMFQRSIDAVNARRNGGAPVMKWKPELAPGVARDWERRRSALDPQDPTRGMWERIVENRVKIRKNVLALNRLAARLTGVISRIDLVASRKSDFLAITSMIESARVVDKDDSLQTVAENIRLLANDIANAEEKASEQTVAFRALAAEMSRALANE
ncbi:MAG: hypothetical protein HY804_11375 [Nitrospinae bacterium]|nr:hypothetical protein [Nitrospinota bacterium]